LPAVAHLPLIPSAPASASSVGMKTGQEDPVPTDTVSRIYQPHTVFLEKKRKQEKNSGKQLVAGTGTVEPFSRPF